MRANIILLFLCVLPCLAKMRIVNHALTVLNEIKSDFVHCASTATTCAVKCRTSKAVIACYKEKKAMEDYGPELSSEDVRSILAKGGYCLKENHVSSFVELADTVGICHGCIHDEASCVKNPDTHHDHDHHNDE